MIRISCPLKASAFFATKLMLTHDSLNSALAHAHFHAAKGTPNTRAAVSLARFVVHFSGIEKV